VYITTENQYRPILIRYVEAEVYDVGKLSIVIFFCFIIPIQALADQIETVDGRWHYRPTGPNDVRVGPNCVTVPVGRILLVRQGLQYCAIKVVDAWTGKTEEYWYGSYESYYQADGTGDFSNKNVEFRKRKLSTLPPWGFGGLHFARGNPYIRCGPIRLLWSFKSTIYFSDSAIRPGVELSPTKWTNISQVNVFDKRLRWYRYGENPKSRYIPMDQLWEDGENQK
jgi:hypothetical protein